MAGYDTMVDRAYRRRSFKPDEQEECSPGAVAKQEWNLPKTALQAMWRGARNRCPSCERTEFFPKFLKPIETINKRAINVLTDSSTCCG